MSGNGADLGHVVSMLHQVITTQADQGRKLDRLELRFDGLEQQGRRPGRRRGRASQRRQ